ncbi:EcsC family protein [Terrabacter ginsenosidimutans]
MSFEAMTPYEQRAWQQSIGVLYAPSRRKLIPKKARDRISSLGSAVVDRLSDLPGADQVKEIAEKAFDGTLALTFQPAMRSARPDSILKRYAERHQEVCTFGDIRKLSLEARDAMIPPKFGYTAASAGQGAVTALAVTGAEVATTVSGGTTAAVVVGAVAADSVASMAMMGRTIGVVATRYGYDVRLPDEELFAMGVLSLGVAASLGSKTQALAALSRLTQQMMRQATWRQLNEHVLVRAVAKAYQMLGLRLTQRKLAQAVPFVGVALNATLSAQLTEQTFRRAQAVYRLRWLSETYGIDPKEWMDGAPSADPVTDGTQEREEAVDVVEVLEDELAEERELEDDSALAQ